MSNIVRFPRERVSRPSDRGQDATVTVLRQRCYLRAAPQSHPPLETIRSLHTGTHVTWLNGPRSGSSA